MRPSRVVVFYLHISFINYNITVAACQLFCAYVNNVFIPSAVGLGMLLMVTIYPLLVAVGVSRLSAAAVVATASCLDLGPASGNSLLAAEISNLHVMEFFIENQLR